MIQCNSCGSFDDPQVCAYCPSLMCKRCRTSHEVLCKHIQELKARGLGATVRAVGVMEPVPPTPAVPDVAPTSTTEPVPVTLTPTAEERVISMPAVLGAPYGLETEIASPSPDEVRKGLWGYAQTVLDMAQSPAIVEALAERGVKLDEEAIHDVQSAVSDAPDVQSGAPAEAELRPVLDVVPTEASPSAGGQTDTDVHSE